MPRPSGSCSTRQVVSYEQLLKMFWENHDPTQGMRQGNDVGHPVPLGDLHARRGAAAAAEASRDTYQPSSHGRLRRDHDRDPRGAGPFYFAEDYHQQYLAKNPNGYCPNHSTGVKLPDGVRGDAAAVRRLRPLQYVE